MFEQLCVTTVLWPHGEASEFFFRPSTRASVSWDCVLPKFRKSFLSFREATMELSPNWTQTAEQY